MVQFPEATKRMFGNMYVCKVCKAKKRGQPLKVLGGSVSCRKCGSKSLRPVRRK